MMKVAASKPDNVTAALAGIRATIEQRIADRDAQEHARVSDRDLAQFDTLALGRRLRPLLEATGAGWRELAVLIGVTSPDLSRIMAGQTVSAAKIFAVCDWARLKPRDFYRPPKRQRRFTGKALKQKGAA